MSMTGSLHCKAPGCNSEHRSWHPRCQWDSDLVVGVNLASCGWVHWATPEPHVPHEPADLVVLLHFSHLLLPLLLLYVFAQLAQFRQRKTKGDCAHSKKKTAKGKSSAVAAPVPEERPVAPEGGALLGGGDARQSAACSGALDEAGATQVSVLSIITFLPIENEERVLFYFPRRVCFHGFTPSKCFTFVWFWEILDWRWKAESVLELALVTEILQVGA